MMRPVVRPILLLALSSLFAGACADSDENTVDAKEDASTPPNTVPDATGRRRRETIPATRASTRNSDATIEAAARICSDDHFAIALSHRSNPFAAYGATARAPSGP